MLERQLQRSAVGWESVGVGGKRLLPAGAARRLLALSAQEPPLRSPHQKPRLHPGQLCRLPRCPDAHALNLYLGGRSRQPISTDLFFASIIEVLRQWREATTKRFSQCSGDVVPFARHPRQHHRGLDASPAPVPRMGVSLKKSRANDGNRILPAFSPNPSYPSRGSLDDTGRLCRSAPDSCAFCSPSMTPTPRWGERE